MEAHGDLDDDDSEEDADFDAGADSGVGEDDDDDSGMSDDEDEVSGHSSGHTGFVTLYVCNRAGAPGRVCPGRQPLTVLGCIIEQRQQGWQQHPKIRCT